MSKPCLHMLMVIVFTTVPSLAHLDDGPPNLISIFGEKPEQNPEPTWRHLLQEVLEGQKQGRLLGENVEESPVAGEKQAEDKSETGKVASANPPTMSPFSHMRKPSRGKVFESGDGRKEGGYDLSYVTKPRERLPLIMRHRKIPPRNLQGQPEPHKHFVDDMMRRPHKPPHEHKPGYELHP